MAHDWSGKKSRSFLWATYRLLIPFNLAVLVLKFGSAIWGSLLLGLCLAPLVIVTSEFGQQMGALMNRHRLRTAAWVLLVLLAVSSVPGPVFASSW